MALKNTPKEYNVVRSRAFILAIEKMGLGETKSLPLDQAPPENSIRNIAKRLRFHLSKIRVPAANLIVIVRTQ